MKPSPLVRPATTSASNDSRKESFSAMTIDGDSYTSIPAKSQITSTDMGTTESQAVAITTQEGIDGSRGKAMRVFLGTAIGNFRGSVIE